MADLFDFVPDDPPAQAHSDTSVAAAEEIKPLASALRRKVYDAIFGAGAGGLTDEEGIARTGLSPSTYRPRRVELWRAGLVRDSGARRKTVANRPAAVWVVDGETPG